MSSPRNHSWDCTLPGPPSRSNGGSADLSPAGLLAFATGSSVAVVDPRSMQLVSVLPMPSPSSLGTSLPSPFVTSVRWTPQPLRRDLLTHEPSTSHLFLAAGDRQGRIALFDFRLQAVLQWFEPPDSHAKLGIQDLCWIRSRSGSWILAVLSGPSILSLHSTITGRCFWKYDSSPEILSCIRRDPFDWRHFCVLGIRGFLLSVKILGDTKDDIMVKELQIKTDSSELQKLERDASNDLTSSSSSPALTMLPLYSVKFSFSPQWKNILFVTFPRELITFDLQYETSLSSVSLPRGSSKFLDLLPDSSNELLYCVHVDGKLSIWKRKEGEQAHLMCMMEELMPSIGTTVSSPSILAVTVCQSDSTLQNVGKIYSDVEHVSSPVLDFDTLDFWDESLLVSKTHLISISDDGNIWNWLLTAEEPANSPKIVADISNASVVTEVHVSDSGTNSGNITPLDTVASPAKVISSRNSHSSNTASGLPDKLFRVCLVGQLQLLSSSITMLAVPTPSLTATLARGGNLPAVAVPLVALGTQTGTIDVVDVTTNAVAASFAVHNSVIRGLRFLGNSRLVSFSYTQVNEKTGGFINKLVVTCLRTGLNRPFRVLQKPERAPVRALRASSSGRYLLILFRDAPVEVWAMTKSPIMLRSLALPFTVLEWTLPTASCRSQNEPSMQSSISSKNPTSLRPTGPSSATTSSLADPKVISDGSPDETTESFAFALVNGALGVFEVHGRRIRDFRPKWPSSSFVSSDGLVTAMAYRLPHVVMGDRSGNIRWWDVTTGHSSSFNTHREGIRRIKFSPVISGDVSRGRIAVLFYDNTFSVFDLDSQDPSANSLLQPQFPGTLGLELDWLPLRTDENDPLILCIAGADGSFHLVEVNIGDKKAVSHGLQSRAITERFRPMPLCLPILLPTPHALALRMILQLGVKPSWFIASKVLLDKEDNPIPKLPSSPNDFRSYMIELPTVGDSVVPEMLLKVLEPYRKEGCILDDEKLRLYSSLVKKGSAGRLAFAAALFGETSEAFFWLQLPRALHHLMNMLVNKSPQKFPISASVDDAALLSRVPSKGKSMPELRKRNPSSCSPLKLMAFEKDELRESASERILWHENLEGDVAIQNRVHELVSVGNLEDAVNLLLSTSPDSSFFYVNALRAVALSSAVSSSLLELAVKVVAANMVRTDKSLSATHLLCAVGRYQEACSQLQDAGCWTDAATLAATHLKGTDYSRVLLRWADHVLHTESNIWRALILYVAGGGVAKALGALREAQLPDTAAMFVLACTEFQTQFMPPSGLGAEHILFPSQNADVIAVREYYGQYQTKLVHLCMDGL